MANVHEEAGLASEESKADAAAITTAARYVLGIVGIGSWAAGAVATFSMKNAPGAVALIGAGALTGLLAMIGRWPSRITISGSAIVWDRVDEVIDSQTRAAGTSDDPEAVMSDLRVLRDRLEVLRWTGVVPPHPAQRYDREVEQAIWRAFPDARLLREDTRSLEFADFLLRLGSDELFVETKWRPHADEPYHGSTLEPLMRRVGAKDKLLVVVNAADVTEAADLVAGTMTSRGRVVGWRDSSDDAQLKRAVVSLLEPQRHPTPTGSPG